MEVLLLLPYIFVIHNVITLYIGPIIPDQVGTILYSGRAVTHHHPAGEPVGGQGTPHRSQSLQ